jgi:hypothetical protein
VPSFPPSGPLVRETADASEVCPGCGAVLAALPATSPEHPGASASCARLFEVTVRGLREETDADPAAAPLVRLADAAYDAQHPVPGDPGRLAAALEFLAATFGTRPAAADSSAVAAPTTWRTTVSDAAADLDVIDLHVLLETWARAVHEDWADVVHEHRARVVHQQNGSSPSGS